jgi:phosphatidate phosphatase APP1
MRRLGGIILFMILISGAGCGNNRVILAGEDVVSVPKKTVRVTTKLVRRSIFLKDIEHQPIEFQLISTPQKVNLPKTQHKITDGEGEAATELYLAEEGLYEVLIKYPGNHKYQPGEDTMTILAVPSAKPVIVFDLDNTVTKGNWFKSKPEPIPYDQDTVRVVGALSKKYAVMYLTARPKHLHRRTRVWLKENGFPDGPILLWYPETLRELSPTRYKRDELLALRRAGINLSVGISNTEGDIKAYRKAGMEPIIIGKKKAKGARVVQNWAEIEKLLLKS